MGSNLTAALTFFLGGMFIIAPVIALFFIARVFRERSSKLVFLKIFGIIAGMKLAVLAALLVGGDDVSGQMLTMVSLFPLLPESIVFPKIFDVNRLSFVARCLRMSSLSLVSSGIAAYLLMWKHDQIINETEQTDGTA